jgi:hypothetical protein
LDSKKGGDNCNSFIIISTIYFISDKSDISRFAVAKTVNNNSSLTVIDLNGRWAAGDNHSAVISQSATNLTIDMSAFHRPSAYGSVLNDSTIAVIFPDDESFNGKLVPPDKIEWSNGSVGGRRVTNFILIDP